MGTVEAVLSWSIPGGVLLVVAVGDGKAAAGEPNGSRWW